MIWLASLDPANLALNIDTSIISGNSTGNVISSALLCCVFGDMKGFLAHLDLLDTKEDKARCAYFASTIWHEQRHFIDLVLTNYGNFAFRQFTTCYANTTSVIKELLSIGNEITFPLDIYIDPVRRKIAKKEVLSIPTQELIRNLRTRERYIANDRKRLGVSTPELGGYAQLEAIGTIFQVGALENHIRGLGKEISPFFGNSAQNIEKYRWFHQLSDALQFKRFELDETHIAESVGFFPILLYASLSIRGWKKDSPDYQDNKYYPVERLGLIIEYAANNKGMFNTFDFDDMWASTNKMAKDLFGRTILEEIEADIFFQSESLQQLISAGANPVIIDTYSDHLSLRKHLFSLLQTNPALLLHPDRYSESTMHFVAPIPIINYPQSIPASILPDSKWQAVHGAEFQDHLKNRTSYIWSAIPTKWPDTEKIGFMNIAAWKELFQFWTPFAKAALKGRNHRTMVGPEFLNMEATLQEIGLSPSYETEFEYPRSMSLPAIYFYQLKGSDTAVCDICRSNLHKSDGNIISPWVFRKSDEIKALTIRMLGGNEDAERKYYFDWSPWFVCDNCKEMLTNFLH